QIVDTKKTQTDSPNVSSEQPPRIRIATFNVQAFDQIKSRKPAVLDVLARIGREFDVLAIQEIQSRSDDVLPRLVTLMNKTGQEYDFAVGPRVGPDGAQEQYGFVFNRRTVQIDRAELYTVDDRDDLFMYEPFVAWFRTVNAAPQHAFTFSLINLRIDPSTAEQEIEYLDQLLYAVQHDGRQEDDIILAGDLQASAAYLKEAGLSAEIGFAVTDVPTNVVATEAWDNLVFYKTSTAEFTGNAGIFDFLRIYNLTIDQALEVSDHLPVWAEFRIDEGVADGRFASVPAETSRR
ncbi:MAG: hypothetical protein KDB23_31080, partial [Planctomycetales bacterium]|nr:hypothetical protein [Planctomycetales bacterium]